MNWKTLIRKKVLKYKSKLRVGTNNELSRIQWLERVLKEIPAGSKILDAGAGEQPYKKFCGHLEYVSQDFAQYDPTEMSTGLQMPNWDYGNLDVISDIAAIPVPDISFDAILCTEVIEHIVNPIDALKEFSRILKSGGYLIITAPFCSLTHFAPYHFYSGFNRFFYEKVLEEDFEKIEINANGNYFEYLAQEINRLPNMAKKFAEIDLNKSEARNIRKLKGLLQKLSKGDIGSSELLCYGYFVIARKK